MSVTDLIAHAAAWNVGGSRISAAEARTAVLDRRFGIHYRPILDTRSGQTLGLLASARFAGSDGAELPASEVFAALHGQAPLLFHAELEIKRLALAEICPGACLWICVDPDSYAAADSPTGNALAELVAAPGVVVRAVENRAAAHGRRIGRRTGAVEARCRHPTPGRAT